MATYKIISRDPSTGETSRWQSNDYRRTVLAARYDHQHRGQHVTVVRADSGNTVIWLGSDMSDEAR